MDSLAELVGRASNLTAVERTVKEEHFENALLKYMQSMLTPTLDAIELSLRKGFDDPFGDGDKTPITNPTRSEWKGVCPPLREAWKSQVLVKEELLYNSELYPLHCAAFLDNDHKQRICRQGVRTRGQRRSHRGYRKTCEYDEADHAFLCCARGSTCGTVDFCVDKMWYRGIGEPAIKF